MRLPAPITVTPPPYSTLTGEKVTSPPKTMVTVDVILSDNHAARVVYATLRGFPRPLKLWEGSDYDLAGDYTQADAESRILELLGDDVQASLQSLYGPQPQ